jgi:hypothetical protein
MSLYGVGTSEVPQGIDGQVDGVEE